MDPRTIEMLHNGFIRGVEKLAFLPTGTGVNRVDSAIGRATGVVASPAAGSGGAGNIWSSFTDSMKPRPAAAAAMQPAGNYGRDSSPYTRGGAPAPLGTGAAGRGWAPANPNPLQLGSSGNRPMRWT